MTTPKPTYWAYWFFSKLGNEIVEHSDNHIITKQENDFQVIIWNYCFYKDNFADGDRSELSETDSDKVFVNKEIAINLSIELSGEYNQTLYTLNDKVNAFAISETLRPHQVKMFLLNNNR